MTEFPLVNAAIFAIVGLLIFSAAFAILDKLTPFHLWKEIIEERNTALAILIGCISIGICIIIAASVH